MGRDKPTILLVHCHYRLPGGEDVVFAAERAMLERRGHRVVVYERSNEEPGLAARALMPLRAVFSLKAWREVRALIRSEGVDLVHVHNTLFAVSPSVFWAARSEKVPVVQTLHNFRLFCPAGVLLRDGRVCEDCPRRPGGLLCAVRHACYRQSRLQSAVCAGIYAFHRLLRTYRRVDLIALTDFDREKLLAFNARRRVFSPQRLWVKPNALSADQPLPPLQPLQGRKNQVVFVGRLEELKGLRTAVEAWRLLEGDPAAPELLLVGSGPLEDWVRRQGVARVRLLGRLPRGQLYPLLAESRAALTPSLCYESFALVPAEAHAMGTPVLASDLGNVGAMVRPGVDGLRFAPGDPAALAAAVRALPGLEAAADPAAMRAEALDRFGEEKNYAQLLAIYRRMLAGDEGADS